MNQSPPMSQPRQMSPSRHDLRIAFITPSLQLLDTRWMWTRDPQIIKLGAPTVAGHLRQRGFERLRLYDFEVQIFDQERAEPGSIDLRPFFDDDRVDAFLHGDEPVLRRQTELYLDLLAVEEADLFGLSCATVVDIYADLHAVGNLNMCLTKVLKERYPGCRTVIGGLKGVLQPEQQGGEYGQMLTRCPSLDFTIQGPGELPMESLAASLCGEHTLVELGQPHTAIGHGLHLTRVAEHVPHIPRGIARQEGIPLRPSRPIRDAATPDEAPEGSHERAQLVNPSVVVTPNFDPVNVELRKKTGGELLADYHLGAEWSAKLSAYMGDRVAVLPFMFMEGCNASCTFCVYSTSKMVKRDIPDTIRALAWLRETYGVRYFYFLNTNINGFYKYADVFCDELIAADLDIQWTDCANLRALDLPLLEKMRRSGCVRLVYGMECPSDRMLEYIKKGITVDQAYKRLKEAHELGIWNHLLLITGLPHETPDDIARFCDFLEMTQEFTDGFSISSFYIEAHSLMGVFPDRYGLELRPHPSGLMEQMAFDEKGGLDWNAKRQQIVWATDTITAKIQSLKIDAKYTSGSIDMELLMWLYDRLGHDAKAEIRRAYEEAWLVAPVHPKAYLPTLQNIAGMEGSATAHAQASTGWTLDPKAALRFDGMSLGALRNGARTDLDVRCHRYSAPRTGDADARPLQLSRGESLTVATAVAAGLADAVRDAVNSSSVASVVTAAGWTLADAATPHGVDRVVVRLDSPDGTPLELMVSRLQEGERSLLSDSGLGVSYKRRPDGSDPGEDPATLGFIRSVGEPLLAALVAASAGLGPSGADMDGLKVLADAVVSDLEGAFGDALAGDIERPDQRSREPGQRRGDRYSVAR